MHKKLDKPAKLRRRRGPKAARRQSLRGGLCLSLVVGLVLNPINITTSNAYPLKAKHIDLALIAMNHFKGDLEESQCWVRLIWAESRFDAKAKNGSHYGLAQMRSTWYRDLNPRAMVKAHMRYLDHRYDGSACKAERHLQKWGWH